MKQYTTTEICKILNISYKEFYNLRNKLDIQGVQKTSKSNKIYYLYSHSDLELLFQDQEDDIQIRKEQSLTKRFDNSFQRKQERLRISKQYLI